MDLLEKYKSAGRPLILDGALGSLLQMRGVFTNNRLWSANAILNNPEEILNIHSQYIASGADIITTNTFRTNPHMVNLSSSGCNSKELVKKAVAITKCATGNSDTVIAGSNPPAEDCYQDARTISLRELQQNHAEHISSLYENCVDIIWNETFSHYDEIKLVCEFCSSENIPYTMNLFIDNNFKILSGENAEEVIKLAADYKPIAIGINCVSLNIFRQFFHKDLFSLPFGFYLNCGGEGYDDVEITSCVTPSEYNKFINQYLEYDPVYIGTCCGSTPEHTKYLKDFFLEIYNH
jgi:homocysteine S-methyltransferase